MTGPEFADFYDSASKQLGLTLTGDEIASFIVSNNASEEEIGFLARFIALCKEKKMETREALFLNVSRLPKKMLMTFDRFNTDSLSAAAKRKIDSLRTLAFIEARRNVIMIGPTGTGKTHLATSIGYECCKNGIGTYFIKMREIQDRFNKTLSTGSTDKVLNSLNKYTCLIIDEVGYCKFTMEETLLFFQLVDRFSAKERGSIVMTSNKDIPSWKDLFSEMDALECALDRLCNDSISIRFSGLSNRRGSSELIEINYN